MIELGQGDALLEAVLSHVDEIPNNGDETHTGALDFTALAAHLADGGAYRYAFPLLVKKDVLIVE